MPAIYSSLYTNFIRQGSQFAKSITTHGYAQSVVAATHPHVLNTQNRPLFSRRHTNRLGRHSNFQLHSAFHPDRAGSGLSSDHRNGSHGGLDAYFEALQKKQASGDTDKEWTQFEFPKRIEWKPSPSTVFAADEDIPTSAEGVTYAGDAVTDASDSISAQQNATLANVDEALQDQINARRLLDAVENQPSSTPSLSESPFTPQSPATLGSQTPASPGRVDSPSADIQSLSYADHLSKLSAAGRYAEIPAVFEAMLATGVKPVVSSYNALLVSAIHLPAKKSEAVSKALSVYADMARRRVSADGDTFDILVRLLASRSLDVAGLKTALEEKRRRFGGMEAPGKFMFASHELEHAILCEEVGLDFAVELFDLSTSRGLAKYSADTYCQLISACARAGRVSDMLRLFEHLESSRVVPYANIFPTMITAFAARGDLVSAVECYNEYRSLAVANDGGQDTLLDRRDAQVYAALISAYIMLDKMDGAVKFFKKVIDEYGARAADIRDALVGQGFVEGSITRGIHRQALFWAQSLDGGPRLHAMGRIATAAADNDDRRTAVEAYRNLDAEAGTNDKLAAPTVALLAMSVRGGDVAMATRYWKNLMKPEMRVSASLIEPTAMYAVALIGSGQVAEGLRQSEMMFERIRAAELGMHSHLEEEVEEGTHFIRQYIDARGIDAREAAVRQPSSLPAQSHGSSPFLSSSAGPGTEEEFDPYAQNTDFKGSSLIAEDLEGYHGRRGSRLQIALNRLHNMRAAGRHARYITYSKLIAAAARESKMELCHEILAMARNDIPPLPHQAMVRYGWTSILDAMVGACLTLGNRGRAEQYHQELLEMGSAPSANTFGLYITTLKDSTKTFDEASEAVRIFHRAKTEGVEPSSFLYNALIGKLGKARRIDDCLFYFSEMRALGIKPTSVTYGTVVNALCRVSDEKFAEELFDEMESMPNYKARPAPYNSMMQFFLTTKRDKMKVLAYHERMRSRAIMPTSHTYKLLIDTHATLEPADMAAAEQVLEMMRSAGQRPEPVHYASLIHARGCVLHDLEGARKIFDAVVDESPTVVNAGLYQALFEAMVANHQVAETEPLLARMRETGIELTPYIANTLIHGWAAAKRIEKAQAIYGAVVREKREPSTYEAMTRAYLAVEQRDRAKEVAGEMLTRGYPSAVANKVLELLGRGQETTTTTS